MKLTCNARAQHRSIYPYCTRLTNFKNVVQQSIHYDYKVCITPKGINLIIKHEGNPSTARKSNENTLSSKDGMRWMLAYKSILIRYPLGRISNVPQSDGHMVRDQGRLEGNTNDGLLKESCCECAKVARGLRWRERQQLVCRFTCIIDCSTKCFYFSRKPPPQYLVRGEFAKLRTKTLAAGKERFFVFSTTTDQRRWALAYLRQKHPSHGVG